MKIETLKKEKEGGRKERGVSRRVKKGKRKKKKKVSKQKNKYKNQTRLRHLDIQFEIFVEFSSKRKV